jgi:hypothetical protein
MMKISLDYLVRIIYHKTIEKILQNTDESLIDIHSKLRPLEPSL